MIGDDPCDDDEQDRSEDRTLWFLFQKSFLDIIL